jgi:hypothetical protein
MRTSQLAACSILTAALALPAPAHAQSAGQAVCTALDALRSFNMGVPGGPALFRQFPVCTATTSSARYYVGSAPAARGPTDILPLIALPFVTTGAYLCGVADSHDTRASSSAAGALGIESRFNVTERRGNTVRGERVGRISLFGASAVLERQDFSLTTAVENVPGNFGNYVDMTSQGIASWDWAPDRLSIPIPAGPGTLTVGLKLELHGRSPSEVRGNQQLTATPASRFRYDEWERCINGPATCTILGCSRPCDPRFEAVKKFKDDRANACPGLCDSLTDNRLPYLGAFGGASGFSANYISFQPFTNWFHLGRPGRDPDQVFDQPVADLNTDNFESLKNHATTWGRFDLDAKYSAAIASIDVKTKTILAVRDGFAIRQNEFVILDSSSGPHALVKTSVDTEAAVDVDATVTVDIDLLPVDPPPFTLELPNIIKSNPPDPGVVGTLIEYPARPSSVLRTYSVRGVAKPDPDAARLQCQLSPTPVTRTATPISNVGEFLRNAARNSVDAIHPCDVRYCAGGREFVCGWSSTDRKLVCRPPTSGCKVCINSMQLCGANGAAIPGTRVNFGSNAHINGACLQ